MNDFELEQAKTNFETVKNNFYEFLLTSYNEVKNPEESAKTLIKYFDTITEQVIKRQPIKIEFQKGASPIWYAEIFRYLSDWIEQEVKICELLSKQIDQ